jgi:hypothetical protein
MSDPYHGEDFCLTHGAEHMRSRMGDPIPWCEACEQDQERAKTIEPTPAMIDAALDAWFKSPPSETDQGLERSMRAALIAALSRS